MAEGREVPLWLRGVPGVGSPLTHVIPTHFSNLIAEQKSHGIMLDMNSTDADSSADVFVTLQFTYAFEDFHRLHAFSWRREIFSYRVVGWLIIVCVALGVSIQAKAGGELNWALLIGIATSIAFLYIRFKKSDKSRWEAAYPQQPLVVRICKDGIHLQYPTITMHFLWSTFHRVERYELGFTLQGHYGQNLFLPYRPMSAEQLERVHELLQFHIGPVLNPTRAFPVQADK